MPESRILVGVIGRPHGVRGLVRVVSYTADPTDLSAYGPLSDTTGRRAFSVRWQGEGIAAVSEIVGDEVVATVDRAAAERLTNTQLFVDRDRLPPTEEDEFYLADLTGLAAEDDAGVPLGRVSAVHDYGAGASLEIERDTAPPLLVPFTKTCVPRVDVPAGRLTVVPPTETGAPPHEFPAALPGGFVGTGEGGRSA